MVGLAGNLYGVKATLYNVNERSDIGLFLVCYDEKWRKPPNLNDPRKNRKKYTNMNTIEENYQIL